MEEHYYNPKNTSLISLGLKPIEFNLETIKKNIKIVKNINLILTKIILIQLLNGKIKKKYFSRKKSINHI